MGCYKLSLPTQVFRACSKEMECLTAAQSSYIGINGLAMLSFKSIFSHEGDFFAYIVTCAENKACSK